MLTVEHWPLERLIPYARNPRKNDQAVDRMCAAIREFGFRIPVVARSDGTVVDGHLRLKAAIRLGLPDVPVALADDLTEAQIKAFRLLANRSAAWAEWDDELLALELQDLQGLGYDLALTGFDAGELRSLLEDGPATGLTDEDAAPEPPATPVTKPGDLILLGSHRLLCGDATKAEDVARLLDGTRPHLMVTDPPYGVDYDPNWRNEAGVSATKRTGKVANDDRADWREAWASVPRRRGLCLARGDPRHHGGRKPRRQRLRYSCADRLVEEPLRARARRLSLAARTVLVRGAQGHPQPLAGRTRSVDPVVDRADWNGRRRHRARHTEAGRGDAPADREQQRAR